MCATHNAPRMGTLSPLRQSSLRPLRGAGLGTAGIRSAAPNDWGPESHWLVNVEIGGEFFDAVFGVEPYGFQGRQATSFLGPPGGPMGGGGYGPSVICFVFGGRLASPKIGRPSGPKMQFARASLGRLATPKLVPQ